MVNSRISMRKLRQALQLAWKAGLGLRPIGRSLGLSPTTVGEYLRRAELAGLGWPLPAELDDATLEARPFPGASPIPLQERPLAEFACVHRELWHKGVTLVLLCQQYKATHPQGLQYSQFCEHYRRFVGMLDLATLLEELNTRPFQKLPGSRRTRFETLDKPAATCAALCARRVAQRRVQIDYPIAVPYTLVKQRVEVRLTASTVEVLHCGQRLASHLRSSARGRHTPRPEHMLKAPAAWTPQRLVRWVSECGPATTALVQDPHHPLSPRAGLSRLLRGDAARSTASCGWRRPAPGRSPLLRRPHEELIMLTPPTLAKLHTLRLTARVKAFEEPLRTPGIEALWGEERLGLLVDRELAWRETPRLATRLRHTKLRHLASVEDIDYRYPRGLNRELLSKLTRRPWRREHHNLLISGPTGIAKSWLACALAARAIACSTCAPHAGYKSALSPRVMAAKANSSEPKQ